MASTQSIWWNVSNDGQLISEVNSLIADQVTTTSVAPQQALKQLESQQPDGMVLDLRSSDAVEQVGPLLEQLAASRKGTCQVVAIGTTGYHRSWTHNAYWAIDELLPYPGDLSPLVDLTARSESWSVQADSRVAAGKSLQVRTYTPDMFTMLDQLVTVSPHPVTLLLVGETGTGKTTLAKLVHELSPRVDEAFLSVPCGTMPAQLITSELFGHVQGAFTGADRDKIGKFEVADRGTILLDEIDVLDAAQQATLLRVIETGEFEPVGCNTTRHTGARIIAATNVDLTQRVQENSFREDLYYRLNVLEFHVPPLRERQLDIVPLTLGFVEEFAGTYSIDIRTIHAEYLACVRSYAWPGNIRELKNHVRRSVLFCRDGELTPEHLVPAIRDAIHLPETSTSTQAASLCEKVAQNERNLLLQALREHNFQRTHTAKALGISRVGLYKKMKKYDLLDAKPST